MYYGTSQETTTTKIRHQYDVNRELGRSLWHQLTDVVILTQQNRVTDSQYAALLKRVAKGTCTLEDYQLLNTRLISNVDMTIETFSNAPIVIPGNDLRMKLNRVHAIHNAKKIRQTFTHQSS